MMPPLPTMQQRNDELLKNLLITVDDFSPNMFDFDERDDSGVSGLLNVDDGFGGPGRIHPTPDALTDAIKARVEDTKQAPVLESVALHRACCKLSVSVSEIEFLLRRDPSAASRSVVLKSPKSVYSPILKKTAKKVVKESYTYPLNLAIMHKASSTVIEMLVDAAPQILATPDGQLQETSLAVFLKYHPHNVATFDKILLECPQSAAWKDRCGNTLGHIGAMYGVDVEIMRHISILCPESLNSRNIHGMTPLDMAQTFTARCSDAVARFLWQQQAKSVPFLNG